MLSIYSWALHSDVGFSEGLATWTRLALNSLRKRCWSPILNLAAVITGTHNLTLLFHFQFLFTASVSISHTSVFPTTLLPQKDYNNKIKIVLNQGLYLVANSFVFLTF